MGSGKGQTRRVSSTTSGNNQGIKLWLDDIRVPPDDSWEWVKTMAEAQQLLETGNVVIASLDHDLGLKPGSLDDYSLETDPNADDKYEETGYDLVKWMAEFNHWPSEGITIHSMNPVGARNMKQTIDRYAPKGLLKIKLF